jgi:hypothetical protein
MSVLSLNLGCNSSLSLYTALQYPNKGILMTNGDSGTQYRQLEIFFFISPYSLYNQSVWQTLSTSCENDLFLETNTYTIT